MRANQMFAEAADAFLEGDLSLALELAEKSLAISPTPVVQHLIGLIHCRQGDPSRGVHYLRSAADARPTSLPFKVMLARALIDCGLAGEVLAMEKPPHTGKPAALALWRARAEAASRVVNHAAAAEAWSVIADHHHDADTWINLGRSLFALNRFNEAERAYRSALQESPRHPRALLELGLIYERTNRLDDLADLLDGALAEGVTQEELSYPWAVREERAGHLSAALEFLKKSDVTQDPVRWHRLRAKIADKQRDFAAAFEATVAMNQATADLPRWRKRGALFRREVRDLASLMTPEWAAGVPQLDFDSSTDPAFLVGFPRSGTTLLDTFLMGHPSIVVIEEKEILRRASETIGRHHDLIRGSRASVERAKAVYANELNRYVDRKSNSVVIDKNPFNMLAASFIHALFPRARVIFAQRHPCDVVLSCFMQSFIPNVGMASFVDLSDAADLYDSAMTVWTKSAELLPLNVHTIRYEDLIDDPEPNLRSVINFLGLDWNDELLDHRASAKSRGAIMNTSYDQVTEPLTRAPIGRWRCYEPQLQPVLPTLLPWAERLGY